MNNKPITPADIVKGVSDGSISSQAGQVALVGSLLMASQNEVHNITLSLAKSLVEIAFREGFRTGRRYGRQYQSADFQSLLGLKPVLEGSWKCQEHMEEELIYFKKDSPSYCSMFPEDVRNLPVRSDGPE